MRITFINNGTGSRIWRLDPYAKLLQQNGHEVILHPKGKDITQLEAEWSDVVILQMVLEKRVIDLFHKYGCVVIYEIDDLIEKVTKLHPSYHKLTRWKNIFRTYNCIRKSDGMFTSTEVLKKRYGWLLPKRMTWVMPNLLDLEFWKQPYIKNTSDEFRIGWAGSWAHKEDLKFINPVLGRICQKYPKVKFVHVGMGGTHTIDAYGKYIYGEDLLSAIPPEQREYHESVDPDVWPSKLANLRLDVGIAPVIDTEFARAKSTIKWLEYSVNRIPGVFSDVLYGGTVRNFDDGLVVENTEQAWFDALCTLVDNDGIRNDIRERAYARATTEFIVEQQYPNWFGAVCAIHSRYASRTGGKELILDNLERKGET